MREERRQVVIEVMIYLFEVVLKVGREILNVVVEYFLEILLDHSQYARQLDVAHARYYVVSNRVVLVAYQYWELDVQTLHHLSRFALELGLLRQTDLPVA